MASEGSVVLRCILNRPDHANMLTQGVMDGLRASLLRAIDDERVQVIVITGAGDSFCEGVDPAEAERFFASKQAYRQFLITVRDLYLLFGAVPKPIIAAVNGTARHGRDRAGAGLRSDRRLLVSTVG